jgi:hypothetical protein
MTLRKTLRHEGVKETSISSLFVFPAKPRGPSCRAMNRLSLARYRDYLRNSERRGMGPRLRRESEGRFTDYMHVPARFLYMLLA